MSRDAGSNNSHIVMIRDKRYTRGQVRELIKQTLIEFITSLSSVVPQEKMVILTFVSCYIQKQDPEKIFSVCEKNLLPRKAAIRSRDEEFVENNLYMLFGDLPPEEVKYVRKMWKSGNLSQDHKNTIWQFVAVLLALTEKVSGKSH